MFPNILLSRKKVSALTYVIKYITGIEEICWQDEFQDFHEARKIFCKTNHKYIL